MAKRSKSRMVTVSLKKNLFGFGKKKTVQPETCKGRSSMPIGQAMTAAFAAGKKSGSTAAFGEWLCTRGLNTRSDGLKAKLRQQYARGVEGEPRSVGTASVAGGKPPAKYKGYRLKKLSSGSFYSPGIDGGKSRFDGLAEIKAFIDSQAKNPKGLPVATQTQGKTKAQIYKKLKGYRILITKPGHAVQEMTAPKFGAAMGIARLRLHEVATRNGITPEDIAGMVPGVHVATVLQREFKAGRKRSRNPISAAEKMYEEFHGTPSTEVIEYITQEHRHSVTAALGKLVSMKIIGVTGKQFQVGSAEWLDGLKPAEIVQVATSEDGRQLFLKGGDQELKDGALKAFGFTDADKHDNMLIGTIKELTYRTKKTFERKGQEFIDFFHTFGKEGSKGVMPVLLYHPRNKNMTISGGRYRIAPAARELGGVSPGVVG
jgi:hypothetical protein